MIVHVKPFEPKKVFGHLTHTGKLTKNGKVVEHWPVYLGAEKFVVDGHGVILNLEKPEDMIFYEIITESDQMRNRFSMGKAGTRKQGTRFYIENAEADSKAYLVEREEKANVDSFINNLDEGQAKRFALAIGIKGSFTHVKASLFRLAESTDGRKKLSAFIHNKSRAMIETIFEAMQYGDPANKKGLYKDGRGVFFWNDSPLGLGQDQTVAYLQQPEQSDLYNGIKQSLLLSRGGEYASAPAKKVAPKKTDSKPDGKFTELNIPE
jgi:hypothetical protein